MENQNPTPTDVATPSVETPAIQAPTGSEAVINPGQPEEQTVPFARFQEVNNGLKAEREAREKMEAQLAEIEARTRPQTPEEEIDPEVEKLLNRYVEKNGLVSKTEIEARDRQAQIQLQAERDIIELTKELSGFDFKKVSEYAKSEGLSINSKADLRAAFRNMNYEAELENARKAAVTEFQESGRQTGETGSTATQQPTSQPQGVKSRIQAAMSRNR